MLSRGTSHLFHAALFLLASALAANTASAQQTITYTNGEIDASPIAITPATNPTTLTVGGTATQSGDITDSGTAGNLIIDGTGTLALTGLNTYTGGTNVQSGTLLANSPDSTGSGPVTVADGGALGGNGTIATSGVQSGNAVTFASCAILDQSAVTNGLGTSVLTLDLHNSGLTTNVDFQQGAIFHFDLGATGVSDQVNVTGGTLTVDQLGFFDTDFTALSGFTGNGTYDLFTTDAGGDLLGTLCSPNISVDGYNATLSIVNSQDLVLTVSTDAAPEPSAWALGAVALLLFVTLRRRRA